MRQVVILGSTGSVGRQTLSVLREQAEHFALYALVAHSCVVEMVEQCIAFRPRYAILAHEPSARTLKKELLRNKIYDTKVLGTADVTGLVTDTVVTDVICATSGTACLEPMLRAAQAGKRLLISNKETLIIAGWLLREAAQQGAALIVPVDSEHSALFQVLGGVFANRDRKASQIILTASGGPCLRYPEEQLRLLTPTQAVMHPTWSMGRKISVDSATLMNKGLEVIEAAFLFDFPLNRIKVVIHPQSIVHSMVEYRDGSVLAQMSYPDMRVPIAFALAYPNRMASGVAPVDWAQVGQLTFEAVDHRRFPCLRLAYQAYEAGQTSVIALNAANEIAVHSFLNRQISFTQIVSLVTQAVEHFVTYRAVKSLDDILFVDQEVRRYVSDAVCTKAVV